MKQGPSADCKTASSWRILLLLLAILPSVEASSSKRSAPTPLVCVRPLTARSRISLQIVLSSPSSMSSLTAAVASSGDEDMDGTDGDSSCREDNGRPSDGSNHHQLDHQQQQQQQQQQQRQKRHRIEHSRRLRTILCKVASRRGFPSKETSTNSAQRQQRSSSFLRGTILNQKSSCSNERMAMGDFDLDALVAELIRSNKASSSATPACWEPVAHVGADDPTVRPVATDPSARPPPQEDDPRTSKRHSRESTLKGKEDEDEQTDDDKTTVDAKLAIGTVHPTTPPSPRHTSRLTLTAAPAPTVATISRIHVVASDTLLRRLEHLDAVIMEATAASSATHDANINDRGNVQDETIIEQQARGGCSMHLPRKIAGLVELTRVMKGTSSSSSSRTGAQEHLHHQRRQQGQAHGANRGIASVPADPTTAVVDLSGTWKPIVTKDFQDGYDAFLQACGESYWARKLILNALGMYTLTIRQFDGAAPADGGDGGGLELVDATPLGSWNRTLLTSSSSSSSSSMCRPSYDALHDIVPSFRQNGTDKRENRRRKGVYVNHLTDPRGDRLQVTAYWCGGGTVHKSYLKSNKPNLRHATFESTRYLMKASENGRPTAASQGGSNNTNEILLVCESTYHPPPAAAAAPLPTTTSIPSSRDGKDADGGRVLPVTVVWTFRRQDAE